MSRVVIKDIAKYFLKTVKSREEMRKHFSVVRCLMLGGGQSPLHDDNGDRCMPIAFSKGSCTLLLDARNMNVAKQSMIDGLKELIQTYMNHQYKEILFFNIEPPTARS